MKQKNSRIAVSTLAGTAFVATLGAGFAAQAGESALFTATELDGGYLLAAKGDAEGKCGEGKCGESKGDAKDNAEGKWCGESKGDAKDSAEGKCGEGKCGAA